MGHQRLRFDLTMTSPSPLLRVSPAELVRRTAAKRNVMVISRGNAAFASAAARGRGAASPAAPAQATIAQSA